MVMQQAQLRVDANLGSDAAAKRAAHQDLPRIQMPPPSPESGYRTSLRWLGLVSQRQRAYLLRCRRSFGPCSKTLFCGVEEAV